MATIKRKTVVNFAVDMNQDEAQELHDFLAQFQNNEEFEGYPRELFTALNAGLNRQKPGRKAGATAQDGGDGSNQEQGQAAQSSAPAAQDSAPAAPPATEEAPSDETKPKRKVAVGVGGGN